MRKRQRKKNEKKRGIYGLPISVAAKRPSEQPLGDLLARLLSSKIDIQKISDEALETALVEQSIPAIYRLGSNHCERCDRDAWQLSGLPFQSRD